MDRSPWHGHMRVIAGSKARCEFCWYNPGRKFTNMPAFLGNFISQQCSHDAVRHIFIPYFSRSFSVCLKYVSLFCLPENALSFHLCREIMSIFKTKEKIIFQFLLYYHERNHHQQPTSQEDQLLPQSRPLLLVFLLLFYILIYTYGHSLLFFINTTFFIPFGSDCGLGTYFCFLKF